MVTKEEKIAKIDEFLKELGRLSTLNYKEGQDYLYALLARLKSLLKLIFSDGEARYRDCTGFSISNEYKTPEEKQQDFLRDIKKSERHLIAYKEELQFQDEVDNSSTKLNKLETKIKEKKLEAQRRQEVTETKFYGAAIEIIDRLRDELKERSKINEEISEIKKDIKEIKEVIIRNPKKEKWY